MKLDLTTGDAAHSFLGTETALALITSYWVSEELTPMKATRKTHARRRIDPHREFEMLLRRAATHARSLRSRKPKASRRRRRTR